MRRRLISPSPRELSPRGPSPHHGCSPRLLLLVLIAAPLLAQDATQAGRLHVEHPTLENLGFEWAISGDENRNASVAVEFRKVGDSVVEI